MKAKTLFSPDEPITDANFKKRFSSLQIQQRLLSVSGIQQKSIWQHKTSKKYYLMMRIINSVFVTHSVDVEDTVLLCNLTEGTQYLQLFNFEKVYFDLNFNCVYTIIKRTIL